MDTATLKSASQRAKDELRANLLSLTEVCPVADCNPEDCPLYSLRKLKPEQRLEWFKALDADDLAYLAAYHHVCINIRVSQQMPRVCT
jgi:hypothetical protein